MSDLKIFIHSDNPENQKVLNAAWEEFCSVLQTGYPLQISRSYGYMVNRFPIYSIDKVESFFDRNKKSFAKHVGVDEKSIGGFVVTIDGSGVGSTALEAAAGMINQPDFTIDWVGENRIGMCEVIQHNTSIAGLCGSIIFGVEISKNRGLFTAKLRYTRPHYSNSKRQDADCANKASEDA